jgi:hypothetical protein
MQERSDELQEGGRILQGARGMLHVHLGHSHEECGEILHGSQEASARLLSASCLAKHRERWWEVDGFVHTGHRKTPGEATAIAPCTLRSRSRDAGHIVRTEVLAIDGGGVVVIGVVVVAGTGQGVWVIAGRFAAFEEGEHRRGGALQRELLLCAGA